MSRAIAALAKTLAEMKLVEQRWQREVDRKLVKIPEGIDNMLMEEEETLMETEKKKKKSASAKGKEREKPEDAFNPTIWCHPTPTLLV